MDATLKLKAEQLAGEIASQAKTLDDVNGLFRTLMKSALERMLDTEMDSHLGGKRRRQLRPTTLRTPSPRRGPTDATVIPRRPSAAIWARSRSTRPAIATAPSSPSWFRSINVGSLASMRKSSPCTPRA
jgi:hypothetical protein